MRVVNPSTHNITEVDISYKDPDIAWDPDHTW